MSLFFLSTLVGTILASFHNDPNSVKVINPPVNGFYAKYFDSGGIPVRGAVTVDDLAFHIVHEKISRMLSRMPAVRQQLVLQDAEVHIIGRDQLTSDLPEFRAKKGVKFMDHGVLTDIDSRARGTGGLVSSCGEENLLGLPTDRYVNNYDVCLHEFAHAIMDFGLGGLLQNRIRARFKISMATGRWSGVYASTNAEEYWAELSMWYFGAHGQFRKGTQLPAAGAESLAAYDPEAFALMDSIYSGKLQPPHIVPEPARKAPANCCSGTGTARCALTIVNTTGKPLRLYWIGFSGKPVANGVVPMYGKLTRSTVASHAWMIRTNAGAVVGKWIVRGKNCEIRI